MREFLVLSSGLRGLFSSVHTVFEAFSGDTFFEEAFGFGRLSPTDLDALRVSSCFRGWLSLMFEFRQYSLNLWIVLLMQGNDEFGWSTKV